VTRSHPHCEGRKNNVSHETGFQLHRDFRSLVLGPAAPTWKISEPYTCVCVCVCVYIYIYIYIYIYRAINYSRFRFLDERSEDVRLVINSSLPNDRNHSFRIETALRCPLVDPRDTRTETHDISLNHVVQFSPDSACTRFLPRVSVPYLGQLTYSRR